MYANLVLLNGKFYTLDPQRPRATAIAVRDGKIVYVGDDATARTLLAPRGEVVDLKGACVVPGLADAHMHLNHYSVAMQTVNCETPTLKECLARVAERAAKTPVGGWILGWGWIHNVWGGQFPTAAMLDSITPNHPVFLRTKSGHAAWVNSKALESAGITASTPNPAGGEIPHEANGQPTGILLESAEYLVARHIPEWPLEQLVEAMYAALTDSAKKGLTQLHDLDGPLSFASEQVLYGQGRLPMRILKSVPLDHLDEAIGMGMRTGFGDDRLRFGQVKMLMDGALGPRTAWMLEGFDSDPTNTGIPTLEVEAARQAVLKANAAGSGCAIHAIGDRANREVLDIYAEAKPLYPQARNRIEHVQLLHPDDWGRLAKLGVVGSMQPIHATSDIYIAEKHWGKRSVGAYAFRTLLNYGTVLAFGSDCPVEVIDPLVGIHAAVTRRRADGAPGPDGWYPDQRLTVEEAGRGFTWGAAYAAGMENKLGSLSLGKLADMTILSQDIFAIDPMEILNAGVLGALVGGQFTWRDASL